MLAERYTDFHIPASIIERMKAAGDAQAQKKEGIAICCETIAKIQSMKGLRGVHIISGGREECVPEILRASGLAGDAN
jgi:methylenetetrahydrofolate reductase (NADPH)